jgi:hypothetical protein
MPWYWNSIFPSVKQAIGIAAVEEPDAIEIAQVAIQQYFKI